MLNDAGENSEYGSRNKEIIFRDTAKRHADLRIILNNEGLKMARFLRECVTFLLDKNPLMLELVDKMKNVEAAGKYSNEAKQLRISKKEREETKNIKKQFQLDSREVENIFDILEEEY